MIIGLLQVVLHLSLGRVNLGLRMTRRTEIMMAMKAVMIVRRSHLLVLKESVMLLLPERTKGRNQRLLEDIGCKIN
jgi:hypothetical protein